MQVEHSFRLGSSSAPLLGFWYPALLAADLRPGAMNILTASVWSAHTTVGSLIWRGGADTSPRS
jgi:hypothetical protein